MGRGSRPSAAAIADITAKLLTACQKKEVRVAGQFGLSATEFRLLRDFGDSRNRSVREILKESGLGGSSLSSHAARPEDKGLIVRSMDVRDRRSVRVSLTGEGVAVGRKLEEENIRIHTDLLRNIPEDLHDALL